MVFADCCYGAGHGSSKVDLPQLPTISVHVKVYCYTVRLRCDTKHVNMVLTMLTFQVQLEKFGEPTSEDLGRRWTSQPAYVQLTRREVASNECYRAYDTVEYVLSDNPLFSRFDIQWQVPVGTGKKCTRSF